MKKGQPNVSNQLRKAIRDSGLTSYAIGKAAKVPPITIDRFMSGERGLTTTTCDRICEALNLELTTRTTK